MTGVQTCALPILDRFKEHNWWLPTIGELVRIAYLYQEYYNPNNTEEENNPLNVFKDALDKGIMSKFSGTNITSSEPGTNYTTSCMGLVVYYNNTYHSERMSQTSKGSSSSVRVICSF